MKNLRKIFSFEKKKFRTRGTQPPLCTDRILNLHWRDTESIYAHRTVGKRKNKNHRSGVGIFFSSCNKNILTQHTICVSFHLPMFSISRSYSLRKEKNSHLFERSENLCICVYMQWSPAHTTTTSDFSFVHELSAIRFPLAQVAACVFLLSSHFTLFYNRRNHHHHQNHQRTRFPVSLPTTSMRWMDFFFFFLHFIGTRFYVFFLPDTRRIQVLKYTA